MFLLVEWHADEIIFQTLLSMNYIKVKSDNGHFALVFANELWIFGVLTVTLLTLTMGYRVYWEYMDTVKERRLEEKQQSDLA